MKIKRLLATAAVILLISSVLSAPVLASEEGENPEPWSIDPIVVVK